MPNDLPQIPPGAVDPRAMHPLERIQQELRRLMSIAVTWEQLASQGLVSTATRPPAGSPGVIDIPTAPGGGEDEEPDLTPPPDVTGLAANAALTHVFVTWNVAAYAVGHGPGRTVIYAAQRDPAAAPAVFADAVRVFDAPHPLTIASIPSEPNTRWHIWAKFESADGVQSVNPAGGLNGVQATTGQDVSHLLQVLTGQITESELYGALNARIDLVDGPDSLAGSVAERILAEATARTSADNANAAAIASEATTRADEDAALASSIAALAASTTGAGQFETYQTWDFTAGLDGWTATGAGTTSNPESVTLASAGVDPQFASPAISVLGQRYDKVRARVKRTAGAGWDGSVLYSTAGHGFDTAYRKTLTDSTTVGQWAVLEWDMDALTAGGSDWTSSTITGLRLDLGASAADSFDIDWIAVGRRGSGVSVAAFAEEVTARTTADSAQASQISSLTSTVAGNTAAISSEATTRASADTAMASDITTLQSDVGANSAAITTEASTRASETGHLSSLYTVRTQVTAGGRTVVGGFGLSGTSGGTAGPEITFGVRADRFYVGATSSASGVGDVLPFVVQTADETVNGVVIPKGVYMDAAYIKNLTAMIARLGNAWIDSAMIDTVSASSILAGSIDVGAYIQSPSYVPGGPGWRIHGDGTAEFAAASIRGLLLASQIDTRGLTIKDASGNIIFSSTQNLDWARLMSIPTNVSGATADVSITGRGTTVSGNTVTKPSGTNGWNCDAYTVAGFTGGAAVTARPLTNSHSLMFGLSSNPQAANGDPSSYSTINFGMYCVAGGTLQVYESGVLIGTVGSYAAGDALSPIYDGSKIRYYKNGVQLLERSASAGLQLHFDVAISTVGGGLSNIEFSPYGNPSAVAPNNPITSGNVTTFIANAAIGTAQVGVLTAGNLTVTALSNTVNGGAASGSRVEIATNVIRVYDSGVLRVKLGNLA